MRWLEGGGTGAGNRGEADASPAKPTHQQLSSAAKCHQPLPRDAVPPRHSFSCYQGLHPEVQEDSLILVT